MADLHGVIVVDKPVGPSSHDVVARVRRLAGTRRVGHTGTLDPLASGVLPLVLGRACRLAQFLTAREKTYEAEITLGLETDTYDVTGAAVDRPTGARAAWPGEAEVDEALGAFRGPQRQEPPPFSAKKVGGRRAYALARQGTPVRPPAVAVVVSRIDRLALEGPRLRVRVTCSAGFYVRSLAHDLGARLGTGGCLSALRRLRSSEFGLEHAVALADAERDPGALAAALVPMAALLPGLPGLRLTGDGTRRARRGNPVGPRHVIGPVPGASAAAPRVRLLDEQGELIAIAEPAGEPGLLHPGIVVG